MSVDLVKVWYQNDWGLYRRRDEELSVRFAMDPRIGRVFHIEPPIEPSKLDAWAAQSPFEANRELQLRRFEGTIERGVHLFTPRVDARYKTPAFARAAVERQVSRYLERMELGRTPYVLWLSAPSVIADIALDIFGGDAERIVVEVEDDHRCYFERGSKQRNSVEYLYQKSLACSDLGVGNAKTLVDEFSSIQPRMLHRPNGVDGDAYRTRSTGIVSPIENLPHPRVCYVGNLTLRLDYSLFEALAKNMKSGSLVLAGPPGLEAKRLAERHSNVHLIGPLRGAQVPSFLASSDVLVMPHRVDEVTRGMNPQKIHEYLASGVPVVSTPVSGTEEYAHLIELEKDSSQFVRAVQRVLVEDTDAKREMRRQAGLTRTWESIATELLDEVLAPMEKGRRLDAFRRSRYFAMDRPEVRALVSAESRKVLDIGCGVGSLGQALKRDRDVEVWGVEADQESAELAKTRIDRVIVGRAPDVLQELDDASFDSVIMADLLEHVDDSRGLLNEVHRVLKDDGSLILSVPNARHWSLLRELLEGDFRYRDAGLLDETHLRFFTRNSLERLLRACRFHVTDVCPHTWWQDGIPGDVTDALLSAGLDVSTLAEESNIHQFLVSAKRLPCIVSESSFRKEGENMTFQDVRSDAVTFICPVVNTLEMTQQFVESLRVHTTAGSYRLIIVDNGSSDGTEAWLKTQSDIQVIRSAENLGFSKAINLGMKEAKSDVIGVINNDVLLTNDWLVKLLRHLDRDPRIGFVAPSTNYAASAQQVDVGPYSQVEAMETIASRFTAKYSGQSEDVDFLVGVCLIGRASTWQEVGEFDERFGFGNFEDNDYCVRASQIGFRLVIARDVFIHHHGSKTFKSLGIDYNQLMEHNQKLYNEKWLEDPYRQGVALVKGEHYSEAFERFAVALQQFPRSVDSYLQVALCLFKKGDLVGALQPLDRYLNARPRSKVALLLKAHAFVGLSRFADALPILEDLEMSFYLDSRSEEEMKKTQASLYKFSQQPELAFEALDVLMRREGDASDIYEEYLELAVVTGDPATMVRALRALSEREPDRPVFRLELASALMDQGNVEEARQEWEKVLEKDPGHSEAKEALLALDAHSVNV